MDKKEQDALINKSVLWGTKFAETVSAVGGSPVAVLRTFSADSIQTMVRNGLEVTRAK